jgi:hypothetical protein
LLEARRRRANNFAPSNTPPTTSTAGIPVPIKGAGAALHTAQGPTAVVVWACAAVAALRHIQITTVNNFIAVSAQNDPAKKRLHALIVRVTVAQSDVNSAKIGMALDGRLF